MKHVIFLGDGMADLPLEQLDHTPLDVADKLIWFNCKFW